MQDQGSGDVVEGVVGEGKRSAQLGHLQVRVATEPPPGQPHHPGAFVDAGHDGPPVAQRREQRTSAAASVENPPASHVPGQGQHRGPLVVGIKEVGLVGGRVRLGEAVILVDPRRISGVSGHRDEPGGDPAGGIVILRHASHAGVHRYGRVTGTASQARTVSGLPACRPCTAVAAHLRRTSGWTPLPGRDVRLAQPLVSRAAGA